MKRFVLAAAAAALLVCVTASHAQTSTGSISLQGRLTGVADGPRQLTFTLHDAQIGGNVVATVGPIAANVAGGVFSSTIAVPPATFDGRTLWWSVAVDGGSPTARQLVTSVPYAANATSLGSLVTVNSQGVGVGGPVTPPHMLYVRGALADREALVVQGNHLLTPGTLAAVPGQIALSATAVPDLFLKIGVHNTERFGSIQCGAFEGGRPLYLNQRGGSVIVGVTPTVPVATLEVGGTIKSWGAATVPTLVITGGSDLAEPFAASPAADGAVKPKPGMVLSIDPEHPGALRVATDSYDPRVAGVYSGGNGLPTGMIMGKEGCDLTAPGEDKLPLAMTGRVWVYADESNGVIKPGDRLTTSGVKPGHAMKVTDAARADGSVIGKAMTGVDAKTGMVLVLVNLQ